MSVLVETSIGSIVIDLDCEMAPVASSNFIKLCKMKYYNNTTFHRVEKDFIAQAGDPTGTGRGGSSIQGILYGAQARTFPVELTKATHSGKGIVGMALPNASQFYITLGTEPLDYLNDKHTIFGFVAEGMEVVDLINKVYTDDESFRPLQHIKIRHTHVLDDPFPDPKLFVPRSRSPSPIIEARDTDYVTPMQEVDDVDVDKRVKRKETQSRSTVLEMIGDLPSADVAPPDTVLFVCKLNPVTRSEDLSLIFSRFGKILSCDVITDYKTGDSLQYAFIEFEEKRSCQDAYLKMENVLIDDRRIHVDFSQSVSRLWNQRKAPESLKQSTSPHRQVRSTTRNPESSCRRSRSRGEYSRTPRESQDYYRSRSRSRSSETKRHRRSRSRERSRRYH